MFHIAVVRWLMWLNVQLGKPEFEGDRAAGECASDLEGGRIVGIHSLEPM